MRSRWILPCLGGLVALACAAPVHAQSDLEAQPSERHVRLTEVQNTFRGPTGGVRIVDASSGPAGTFRLALSTEFFIIGDFFFPTDRAHHFAGNLSLSITPTPYLEVFASAEVTSAWNDSNDPLLIQRVADVLLGLKGFYQAKPWVAVGGDASIALLGGVGDMKATLRATSFGFRGNLTLDFRKHESRDFPLIARFNAQYWFDNSAQLTEGIEDLRFAALETDLPRLLETRHLLTAFERFAYGVNRTDLVWLGIGLEAPLSAGRVGLHPLLEWQWGIPVGRQGFQCPQANNATQDGCLTTQKLKAFPMSITFGLRISTPPEGLAFTVAADVGLTGARHFAQELAPTAPYNVIVGIAYAFDPRPAAPAASPPLEEPVAAVTPIGEVRGRVFEQGGDAPIEGAVVAVVGDDASPLVTDSAGGFVTYGLPEGEVVLELSHPDYETSKCRARVPSDVRCALTPSSLDGQLRILAVDREGKPIPRIAITVRGPSEHRLVSDLRGIAAVEQLPPGAYTAHVDDPAYLIAVADLDIVARQETTVQLRILPKPSRPRVVIKKNEIALRRQVSFATGSDEILPNSEPILIEVADALLRNPDLELVEVQGHTDNRGDREVNMRLSQQRAEAVRRWLMEHGVGSARLTAKGYGPTHPLAPNITQQNRARNRRVQFKILRRADQNAAASR